MDEMRQKKIMLKNFDKNLSTNLYNSLIRGDYVDVTLLAGGQFIKAHKLILSISSPYFQKIFARMESENQELLIALNDVCSNSLKNLIKFIYTGEVVVSDEELEEFSKTAELLQIQGLSPALKEFSSIKKTHNDEPHNSWIRNTNPRTQHDKTKIESSGSKSFLNGMTVNNLKTSTPKTPAENNVQNACSDKEETVIDLISDNEIDYNRKIEPPHKVRIIKEEILAQRLCGETEYCDQNDEPHNNLSYELPKFATNNRGGRKLLLSGYSFFRNGNENGRGITPWKCSNYSKFDCPAMAKTWFIGDVEVAKSLRMHNHYPPHQLAD